QEFSPSKALSFLFLLKKVIRAEVSNEAREYHLFDELSAIESRIDELVNISFDIYMQCREKIYELKANEMRNWTYRLLQNTNMVKEAEAEC
ncbi:MAG: RsbRD N-terminal domain-containing protein, partial [Nitrospirota bacterium]